MSISPLTSTTSRPASADLDADQLSDRIARLRARQKLADQEQADIDRERRELAHLQRVALDGASLTLDRASLRRNADDAPPARPRQAEVAENDGDVVTDGVADPAGFARSAMRAAAMARGQKV